jgi:Mannosyltransferase (PIG-V)
VRPFVTPRDRPALHAWLITRLGMVAIAVVASSVWARGNLQDPFLDRITQWDVDHFIEIARYGYRGNPSNPPDAGLPGFFPGLPLAIRALHLLVPDWRLSALLISLVSGAVAMVALRRLGDQEGTEGTGRRAVIALLLSPFAVFLFAGYSEALFLAFALPAWMLARQRRWELAAVLACLGAGIRVTGLFLALALIVEFLAHDRRWRKAPWLLVPFLAPLLYFAYLWWWSGGDLNAWQHAQQRGWGRKTVDPWQALKTTWDAAFGEPGPFTGSFRVELIAAALGVLLTLWLLLRRRWAESAYLGSQMAALLTSAFYLSIGRSSLMWWPLWLMIGGLGVRRGGRWVYLVLLVVMVPLLAVEVVRFTEGSWAG